VGGCVPLGAHASFELQRARAKGEEVVVLCAERVLELVNVIFEAARWSCSSFVSSQPPADGGCLSGFAPPLPVLRAVLSGLVF